MSRQSGLITTLFCGLMVLLFVSQAYAANPDSSVTVHEALLSYGGITFGALGDHQLSRGLAQSESSEKPPTLSQLALRVGYDYSEWISIASEWDLSDAASSDESGGVSVVELSLLLQLYDNVGIRVGRIRLPSSVENLAGDPVMNRTVVKSGVATSIIPCRAADGIGVNGSVYGFDYAAYFTDGLDVSEVSMEEGLGGSTPVGMGNGIGSAVMARLSWEKQFDSAIIPGVYVGSFAYSGNGKSLNWTGESVIAEMRSVSLDIGCEIGPISLHGLLGQTYIKNASQLGAEIDQALPSQLRGVDVEAWANVFPDSWNEGLFAETRVLPHVRYENIINEGSVSPVTAMIMGGDVRNRDISSNVSAWTVGFTLFAIDEIAMKLDYRNEYVKDTDSRNTFVNFGLGWFF
jgi:hypothetical protein